LTAELTALANSCKGSVRQKGQVFATLEVLRRSPSEKEGDELCQ
jgi:hypothetical protein